MSIRNHKLRNKLTEAVVAVVPIIMIVLVLCFSITPFTPSILLSFLMGAIMVIFGMMFFTLGAEMSMTMMGEKVGVKMTQTKNVFLIVCLSFLLGVMITISEPDLQVLATLVPSIPNMTIILAVAIGVGIFLVLALIRILYSISLAKMLVFFYIIVFILASQVSVDFRAVAFDSGGVTTGPMTVPFIMALGIGIAAIRSDRNAADDSFGLVSLCSVGPIIAVLILGLIFNPSEGGGYSATQITQAETTVELGKMFAYELPAYMEEIAISLLPIIIFFGIFQVVSLKLTKRKLSRIVIGLAYTYIGLVLFLTGANVGFMPAGSYLGTVLASGSLRYLLIPIGALIGYFIVKAEPAVYVLNHQVEELTDGRISAKAMGTALSLGVSASVALAMIRVLTGIPVLYFLVPGYAIAIILSFKVPKIFTAIAFDSGGVASGPMTATFLLPLAQGACVAVGGNVVADAFGVVAMVAMTPLIAIQIMGAVQMLKQKEHAAPDYGLAEFDDDTIIDL